MLYQRYEPNLKATPGSCPGSTSSAVHSTSFPLVFSRPEPAVSPKIKLATHARFVTRHDRIILETRIAFDKAAARRRGIGADYHYGSAHVRRFDAANDSRPDAMTEILRARGVGRLTRYSFNATPEDRNLPRWARLSALRLIDAGFILLGAIGSATRYLVARFSHTMVSNGLDGHSTTIVGAGQQRSALTGR